MSERIRFHLDENVDPAVADGLRRRGVDATTTQLAGLLHAPDDAQLAFALAERRLLSRTTKTFWYSRSKEFNTPELRTAIRNCVRSVN